MRTTLTLDDDIAARLRTEARKSGVSFRVAVNEYLRAGLTQRRVPVAAPFRVEPVSLGAPLSGRSYDNIAALLKDIEDAAQ
jgi:plasmid stability protein